MRRLFWDLVWLLALPAVLGCTGERFPQEFDVSGIEIVVLAPAGEQVPEQRCAEELSRWLGVMTGAEAPPVRVIANDAGPEALGNARMRIVLGRGPLAELLTGVAGFGPEEWLVARVEGGAAARSTLVATGQTALGAQYAAYALAEQLGVGFLHPERDVVTRRRRVHIGWPLWWRDAPAFAEREISLSSNHPVELVEALISDDAADLPALDRIIAWTVKLRQNALSWQLLAGVPRAPMLKRAARIASEARFRGLAVGVEVALAPGIERALPLLDPDDALDEVVQIRARIAEIADAAAPSWLVVALAPPAPGVTPERAARWLSITHAELGLRGIALRLVTRGDAESIAAVRAYASIGAPGLTVEVEQPPWGSAAAGQASSRIAVTLWHGLDVDVPLSPLGRVAARARDARAVEVGGRRTMVLGSLEWGHWLAAHAQATLAARPQLEPRAILEQVTRALGGAPAFTDALWQAAVALDRAWTEHGIGGALVSPDGALALGHEAGAADDGPVPDRLPIGALAHFDRAALERWDAGDAAQLDALASELEAAVSALKAEPLTPAAGAEALADELCDGLTLTALRARHALAVRRAVAALRRAALETDPIAIGAQRTLSRNALLLSDELMQRARTLIATGEARYRYPRERTLAGSGDDAATANPTGYDFRVLAPAHDAAAFVRERRLAEAAIEGTTDERAFTVIPETALVGGPVVGDATLAERGGAGGLRIRFGVAVPRTLLAGSPFAVHLFDAPGRASVILEGQAATGASFAIARAVTVARARLVAARGSLGVAHPDPAVQLRLGQLLLPLIAVIHNDGSACAMSLAPDMDGDGAADPGAALHVAPGELLGTRCTFAGAATGPAPLRRTTGASPVLAASSARGEFELSGSGPDAATGVVVMTVDRRTLLRRIAAETGISIADAARELVALGSGAEVEIGLAIDAVQMPGTP